MGKVFGKTEGEFSSLYYSHLLLRNQIFFDSEISRTELIINLFNKYILSTHILRYCFR